MKLCIVSVRPTRIQEEIFGNLTSNVTMTSLLKQWGYFDESYPNGGCQVLYAEFRENHHFSWEIFLFSGTRENE